MTRTDSNETYSEFAGPVVWPRGAAELTDTTRCPACHALLRSSVCSTCGLDLRARPAASGRREVAVRIDGCRRRARATP